MQIINYADSHLGRHTELPSLPLFVMTIQYNLTQNKIYSMTVLVQFSGWQLFLLFLQHKILFRQYFC